MKEINKFALLLAFVSFVSLPNYAQDDFEDENVAEFLKGPKRQAVADKNPMMTISGTVVDQVTNQPVVGAQLQTLGDKRYVAMTEADGTFTMKVPTFATSIYVQAPMYSAQQVGIKTKKDGQKLKIRMLSDVYKPMYKDGTDYTATGGFTTRGNTKTIDEEINSEALADVRAVMRSATPGAGAAMFIRGLNSINANSQPLVVIDGVEQDMQLYRSTLHDGQSFNMLANISPEDIEKVTVLKNATALYGARGGNGVILIETKRGHSMATKIDANISVGFTLLPKLPTVMNAQQYRTYASEMLGTMDIMKDPEYRNLQFNFLDDDPTNFYYNVYHNDTDWQKEVYKTAVTQNYNINVQGGDDIGMYNLSVGYLKAPSTAKKNDFDRLNVRFNTDIKILWNLSTKFDMSFSRTNNNVFDDGAPEDLSAAAITSPTFLSLIKAPIVTPYQYNQIIGGFSNLLSDYDEIYSQIETDAKEYSLANPVAILQNAYGDNSNKAENTFFNVRLEPTFQFNDHWSATTLFSYNLNRNSQRYSRPYNGVAPFRVEGLGVVTSMAASLFSKETSVLSNTHVDYNTRIGAHKIDATGGFRYTYFSYDGNNLSTQYTGETSDKNPALSNSSDAFPGVEGANDAWKNLQWYLSGDYNYMNRYFATLSLLAESNSRFGTNSTGLKMAGVKWALYPSIQLGWVLSNEDWFSKNSVINYLRLNAGFDISGNDDISNYAARTSFNAVRFNYDMIGMQLTNIGNDNIKAERTNKYNIGLQAYLFNNRLGLNADFYIHKTNNLLTYKTFENPIGGINQYWTNGGSLKNTGFEFGINGKPLSSRDWQLEVGATVGHYKNEVTKLPDGEFTSSIYGEDNILTREGCAVGVFYGYKTNGVFASDAQAKAAGKDGYLYMLDESGNKQCFTAGDVHFVDLNNDGVIDANDKTIIGDPNPDLYGNIYATLSWKRFTLNLGFNYSLGNDVYNYQRSILNSGSTLYNQQVSESKHWYYEGQVAELPKLAYGDPMGNNRFSDRWIEDGSYLRMKTLRLNYQIPIPESWQSWLQGISVWGEAQNVFTITKYKGSDPEFSIANGVMYQGIDAGYLAQSRGFSVGVKINL